MISKKTSLRIWIVVLLLWLVGTASIFALPSYFNGSKEALIAFGSSCITAGFLTALLEHISLREIVLRVHQMLEEGMGELSLRNYGLLEVLETRPYKDIAKQFKRGGSLVVVQTWCPQTKFLLETAEKVVTGGGCLSFFFLDPDCAAAKQRGVDLGADEDFVPNKVIEDTKLLRKLYAKLEAESGLNRVDLSSRITLHYYEGLPSFAIYKAEQKTWVAPYCHDHQADNSANWVLRPNSQAMDLVNQQIDSVRRRSTEVDLRPEYDEVQ